MKTPINETSPGKCWCIACDKKNRDAETLCFWEHEDIGVVCTYLVCKSCYCRVEKMPANEQQKVMDEVEDEIVSRYPEVLARLPDDWTTDR